MSGRSSAAAVIYGTVNATVEVEPYPLRRPELYCVVCFVEQRGGCRVGQEASAENDVVRNGIHAGDMGTYSGAINASISS